MKQRDADDRSSSSNRAGLDRRQLLGLIGVGGLAWATTKAGAQPPACDSAPCPATSPTVPPTPDLRKFPKLARFVSALAGMDKAASDGREAFNTCPNKFLREFFELSDDDVKQVLNFDPLTILGYIGQKLPTPTSDPAVWREQYVLAANTMAFWDWWKTNKDDCFKDPLGCTVPEQYGLPNTQIYGAKAISQGGGKYTIEVNGQGFVDPIKMTLLPGGTDLAFKVHGDSTFRCGRLNAEARLTQGQTYSVTLNISGFELTSDTFAAA